MVKFGPRDVEKCKKLAEDAEEKISSKFLPPNKLEFEKLYQPYLLLSKKHYSGVKRWTCDDGYIKKPKPSTMGLANVKRDTTLFCKYVMDKVLEYILIDNDIPMAKAYVKREFEKFLNGEIDIQNVVLSKGLSRELKDYDSKQAHVELAKRIQKKNPDTAPRAGDRVKFVIVCGTKKARNFELTRTPDDVVNNDLNIDYKKYLSNKVINPIKDIFDKVIGKKKSDKFFAQFKNLPQKKKLSKKSNRLNFTIAEKCQRCKSIINDPREKNAVKIHRTLCRKCGPYKNVIGRKLSSKVLEHKKEIARMKKQCIDCQGKTSMEIICANTDCSIFYKRKTERKELEQCIKKLEGLDW